MTTWWYSPDDPALLEPIKPVKFEGAPPPPIAHFARYWRDREVHRHRRTLHPELRKRRTTVRLPDPDDPGKTRRVAKVYTPGADQPEHQQRRPKGDRRALVQRALVAIVERASWRNGLTGIYVGERWTAPLSRHQWAAAVGCTVKQWDRIVSDLKAAGYIKRRQRRDKTILPNGEVIYRGRLATLLLTHEAWFLVPGAWRAREDARLARAKAERKAAQAKEPPREHPAPALPPEEKRKTPAEYGWPTEPPDTPKPS